MRSQADWTAFNCWTWASSDCSVCSPKAPVFPPRPVHADRGERRSRLVAPRRQGGRLVDRQPGRGGGAFILVAQPRRETGGEAGDPAQKALLAGRVVRRKGRNFTGEVARLSDQEAPLLAGLPPTVVTGVVAKAKEEDRQTSSNRLKGASEISGKPRATRARERRSRRATPARPARFAARCAEAPCRAARTALPGRSSVS